MKRFQQSNGAASPPSSPSYPANNYPTKGNPGGGVAASTPGEWFYHMVAEELQAVVVAGGLTPDHATLTQVRDAIAAMIAAAAPAATPYMKVSDVKAAGTSGGSSSSGSQTRTLNTVDTNTIGSASLSSNQITLPAGTYDVFATAPCARDAHRAYLWNVTDSSVLMLGTSENGSSNGSDLVSTQSTVRGRFTIAASKVIELRHQISSAGTDGLGYAINDTRSEVYSIVELRKVA